MTTRKQLLLAAAWTATVYGLASAQTQIGKWVAGEQQVMVLGHTGKDGRKTVIAPESVPVFVLRDADGLHSAPLPDGSTLLCRELYGYHDEDDRPRLAWACGNDTFITDSMNYISRDEAKKLLQEPVRNGR